ncbi:MAG: glucan biosynthesis protein [Haliea sp.]|nr:glucan biosynthesis protein [Haliea sp.]
MGRGRIELVQLSTPDETNDNIVAYRVPGSNRWRANHWNSPTDCTVRAMRCAGRPAHGSCRRVSAADSPNWRKANSSSSSILRVHRSTTCRRTRPSRQWSPHL